LEKINFEIEMQILFLEFELKILFLKFEKQWPYHEGNEKLWKRSFLKLEMNFFVFKILKMWP
jgi:hypothetical protein